MSNDKIYYGAKYFHFIEVELSHPKKIVFIYFNENPLKMMKNAFYLMLKPFFVLGIIMFLFSLFGDVEKQLDKKAKLNFKIFDVTDWTINNYNTYIVQYFNATRQ